MGVVQCGDIVEDHGFASLRTTNFGTVLLVCGERG